MFSNAFSSNGKMKSANYINKHTLIKQPLLKVEAPEKPPADIFELETGNGSKDTCVLFKLTDECCAAIKSAIVKKWRIQLQVGNQVTLQIVNGDGETLRFSCHVSSLNGPLDAISKNNKTYRTISSLSAKLQVEATDRTFAEVKEKTKKLVEEDEKKKAKDMPEKGRSTIKRNEKPTQNKFLSQRGPPFSLKSKSSVPPPTNKFVKRYSSQSLQDVSPAPKKLKSDEISTSLSKRPNEFLSSAIIKTSSTPQNKKVNESLVIPKRSEEAHATDKRLLDVSTPLNKRLEEVSKSPDEIVHNTTKTLTNSAWSNQPSPSVQQKNNLENLRDQSSSSLGMSFPDLSESPASETSRLSSASISPVYKTSSKPSTGSSSPYTTEQWSGATTPLTSNKNADQQIQPPPSSLASLTCPSIQEVAFSSDVKPSTDWNEHFPKIEKEMVAKKYLDIYWADYPVYKEVYLSQNEVVQEFLRLKISLQQTRPDSSDYENVLSSILSKYDRYQKDAQFLKNRQLHIDLRSKLVILEQRLNEWKNSLIAPQK